MDATATGADEIGIGFSKTGGAAAALGVEFEKVASWIAVISSKTRESAESIGFSINTILSRMSRITTTGFNEEDDTKLNDVAQALASIDIALTDSEGNFRDFGIIVDEVGSKFGSLSDKQKSYIASTLAGTRQQSRFFNLMEGYAESIGLYEEALESAGTAQSKFNLYLESNQATLDTFRTTIEGLWTTIIDSDSLMSIVRAGTSFIELLDSMVQKFGTVGSILNILIPLIGVKFVWAIRAAYIEMVKLQATGSMSAFMPTTKILGQIVGQMLGLKVAAGGATVAVGGLTLATAGLTAGIGLIAFALIKWAQKSQEAKQAFADALDNSQKLNEEVQTLENLAQKQEELTKIENKSVAQKEELLKVQRELVKLYPQLATGIDSEGNKIADNLEMTKQLTEEKRKLLEQELLVIKTTANTRLPQLRKELADMQNEADEIQNRLTSGNTVETEYIEGYAIQIDKTKELKDRLLELVNAQKENYEETAKLEDGVKSYNKILEENAERQKWATVEELKGLASKAKTTKQLEDIEKQLKDLGFTSDDVANIISGNIDLVKDKYKELDIQQIINLQTIETLDATQQQAMINMLNSSSQATKQLIADTQARIKAIMAEAQALASLTGGKVKNASVGAKKGTIDPKTGLFSNLSTVARNEAIDAQRELVNLEGNLKDIEKALANVSNIDTKQISGIKDGKSSSSSKDQYKAEADRYAKINLELDKNNVLLAKNKTLQELAKEGSAEQLTLIQEENALYKERQGLLNELNIKRREEVKQIQKDLSLEGFKFTGSGDSLQISNLENIEGKSEKVEKMVKRLNELQSNLIPQTSQQWWDYQQSIVSNIEKIESTIQSHIDQLKALEDELADFDLSGKIADLDKQLDTAKFNHWIESLILGLERYNDKTELLSFKLSLFDEEDYENRADVIGDLYEASKDKLEAYREEWDKLSAQTPKNANEANQIANAMKQVQQGMREAFVATREYQRQLEQLQFDSISKDFEKANKQLELQLSIIDNNLQSLQDGILPDFSLDMVMPIPDFSDIFDETASENEKLYNEQVDFEEQIQALKKQSLEMQLAEAEQFYEDERKKLIKHYKELTEKIAEKEREILELQEYMDEQQKQLLQQTSSEIQAIVDKDLGTLETSYETSWGNIVETVSNSVAEIKRLVSQANSAIASMGSVSAPSGGGSGGSVGGGESGTVEVNPDGKAPPGLPVGTIVETGGGNYEIVGVNPDGSYESKKVKKYAKGTDGHQGGLAILGDERKGAYEMAILPSGKAVIIGETQSQLVDLPKGNQVIPHEETKDILSHTGNIDGKTIPKYKDGTGEAIPQYAIGTGFIAGIVGAVASTLASTVSKVSGTSAELKNTKNKLNKANDKIDRLNDEIDDLSDNLGTLEDTTENTNKSLSEFEKLINEIKPDFRVEMSSAFKEGSGKYSEDIYQVNNFDGYDKYLESRKESLKEIADLQKKYLEGTDKQITQEQILSKIDAQMLEDTRTQSWLKVDLLEQMKVNVDAYTVALKEQYDASLESGNTELATQIFEEYNNMLSKQMQIENQIQQAIKQRYEMEFAFIDKKTAKEEQYRNKLKNALEFIQIIHPDDEQQIIFKINNDIIDSLVEQKDLIYDSSSELLDQLELLEVGSSEWNIINDKLEEYSSALLGYNIAIENAIKQRYEMEFAFIDKKTAKEEQYRNKLKNALEFIQIIHPDDEQQIIFKINNDIIDSLVEQKDLIYDSSSELLDQLELLEVGSSEWNIINDKLEEYSSALLGYNIAIENAIKQRYEMEFAFIDKKLSKEEKVQDVYRKQIDILKELNPDDYGKFNQVNELILQSEQNKLETLKQSSAELKAQLALLEVGSSEWNLVNDRINEVNDSMMDSTLEIIKLNKEILRNKYEQELSRVEKNLFGGQTQEEAQKELDDKIKYQDQYVGGLEKELMVSKLISQARKDEVQLTKEELAILNQAGNLERVKLERLEKQLQIRAAEQRLENIRNQKTIQQLTKNADGTFDFKYVADQDAIDQAEVDLKESKVALINWERDLETSKQQEEINSKARYLDELRKLTEKSLNAEYQNMLEFYADSKEISDEFLEIGTSVSETIGSLSKDFGIFLTDLREFRKSIERFAPPTQVTPLPTIIDDVGDGNVVRAEVGDIGGKFNVGGETQKPETVNDKYVIDENGNFYLKRARFKSGGETDRTGLHWLDGKDGEPERILSAQQTKDFNKLVANMPDILKFLDTDKLTDVLKSAVLSTVNVAIPRLPQIALAGNNGGSGDQIFHIDKVEFPNITTADEATKAIMNLPNRVKQRTRIIGVD